MRTRSLLESFLLTGVILWISIVPGTGQARVYFNTTPEDFFQKTNFIFVGELLDKQSFRSDDGRFIMTRHVFQLREAIKGDPGPQVEIVEYGGTLAEMTLEVSHTPAYLVGQEYLVFTYQDLRKQNRTWAGPLGQLPVLKDARGRRAVRLYASHPLTQVLQDRSILQDLELLSRGLREALKETAHENR